MLLDWSQYVAKELVTSVKNSWVPYQSISKSSLYSLTHNNRWLFSGIFKWLNIKVSNREILRLCMGYLTGSQLSYFSNSRASSSTEIYVCTVFLTKCGLDFPWGNALFSKTYICVLFSCDFVVAVEQSIAVRWKIWYTALYIFADLMGANS